MAKKNLFSYYCLTDRKLVGHNSWILTRDSKSARSLKDVKCDSFVLFKFTYICSSTLSLFICELYFCVLSQYLIVKVLKLYWSIF